MQHVEIMTQLIAAHIIHSAPNTGLRFVTDTDIEVAAELASRIIEESLNYEEV